MGRVAAWILATAVVAAAGCASQQPLSLHTAQAQGIELPTTVAVSDGQGGTLELRLAGVAEGGVLVSQFGMRRHPLGGGGGQHDGIDIKARRGAPVRPAAEGTVVQRGWGTDFGRFVRIRHGDQLETLYAHLTRFAKPLAVGQTVTPDDVIGYVGSTGRSTGPHVHLEVRRAGKPIDPLNTRPVATSPPAKKKSVKARPVARKSNGT